MSASPRRMEPAEPEPEAAPEPGPWYRHGLHFACTGCGNCCTIEGHVWVDRREVRRLARHLGLALEEFGREYLRRIGSRYSLTEIPFPGNPAKKACVFWDRKCTVYEARPTQCRTFPFWNENVKAQEAWEDAARLSPGIGHGRLYRLGEIEELLDGRGETGED